MFFYMALNCDVEVFILYVESGAALKFKKTFAQII